MRKLLIAVVLGLATSAGVAVAATPTSGTFKATKGQIQRGYDLRFTVSDNKIKNVVAHVLETCDGSSTSDTTTVGPNLTWTIKGGTFSGRKKESAHGVTVYTTLEGKFTSATTVKGIIRQESVVAGSLCDTYKLKFTAKRG
jgi:hypothetical protein